MDRARYVVVVEKDEDQRLAFEMLLELWGYEAGVAATGEQGLDAVAARRPDVMFINVNLPGIDGVEVVRRVRSMPGGDQIRLVATTGYGHLEKQCLQAGFDDYFTKPFDMSRVEEVLAAPARKG
jgi:CheY-like chemotaxis protein